MTSSSRIREIEGTTSAAVFAKEIEGPQRPLRGVANHGVEPMCSRRWDVEGEICERDSTASDEEGELVGGRVAFEVCGRRHQSAELEHPELNVSHNPVGVAAGQKRLEGGGAETVAARRRLVRWAEGQEELGDDRTGGRLTKVTGEGKG